MRKNEKEDKGKKKEKFCESRPSLTKSQPSIKLSPLALPEVVFNLCALVKWTLGHVNAYMSPPNYEFRRATLGKSASATYAMYHL